MFRFNSFIILAVANVKQESFTDDLAKPLIKWTIKLYMAYEIIYSKCTVVTLVQCVDFLNSS